MNFEIKFCCPSYILSAVLPDYIFLCCWNLAVISAREAAMGARG